MDAKLIASQSMSPPECLGDETRHELSADTLARRALRCDFQERVNRIAKSLNGEWLREKSGAGQEGGLHDGVAVGSARNEEDWGFYAPAADLLDEGDTAGVGEPVVADDESDIGIGGGVKGTCGVEMLDLTLALHAFAKILERLEHERIVVNQKYGGKSGGSHSLDEFSALRQVRP